MWARLKDAIAMGLSLAACGDGPDGVGVTEGSSGAGGTSVAGTSSTSTGGSAASEAVESNGDGPKYDVALAFDIAIAPDFGVIGPIDCTTEVPLGSTCEIGPSPSEPHWVSICIPGEVDGCPPADLPAIYDHLGDCASSFAVGGDCGGGVGESCGPANGDGSECCYWAPFDGFQCPGRPFSVDGRDRIAQLTARDDWCAPWPAAAHDHALAQAWLFDARHEHAAIASFARFALQLLALGAPPRFVAEAWRAADDERAHALLFFGLARAHGAAALGPDTLDVSGALAGADDVIDVVTKTVREGCVAETISAMLLQRACETAADPQLRAALQRVLAEELRHVELAWSFVAWACARGDERLVRAVVDAFDDAERCIPRGPELEPAQDRVTHWRAAGRCTRGDALAIAVHTIRTLVVPAARELVSLTATRGTRRDRPAPTA